MNATSTDYLKRLGSGVRAEPVTRTATLGAASGIEHADFASLLDQAQSGKLSSAQPISVATGAGVELSSSQLERLAAATDAAEAAGSQRLLALIDGQAVTIDVSSRTVTGGSDQLKGRVLTDVDAFVIVPDAAPAALRSMFASSPEHGPQKVAKTPGLDAVHNDSLAALLASLGSSEPDSAAA